MLTPSNTIGSFYKRDLYRACLVKANDVFRLYFSADDGYKTYIGEKKEENQKRTTEEETLTQKTEINFLNKKEVIPPTGVETTMTAWLLMTGVTLLLGAVFLLFGIRRKRFVA